MKPKKNKVHKKTIYRSGLESTFARNTQGEGYTFEPERMPYIISRKYVPDFVKGDIVIECKGFFRAGDTLKYKSIRDCYPNKEFIFVLSNPEKKVRKGSKLNMGQWCFKEGFAFFTVKQTANLKRYLKLSDGDKLKYKQMYLTGV
tara:strand:+ start:64 stop:498 length:435 start_codon:yes stop_codon:yes gene_type:complete